MMLWAVADGSYMLGATAAAAAAATAARAGVLPLLERWRLMEVALVPVRADAADMRLVQDAMAFADTAAAGGSSNSSNSSYEDSGSESEDSGSRRGGSGSSVGGGLCLGDEEEVDSAAAGAEGLPPAVLCVSQDTGGCGPVGWGYARARALGDKGTVADPGPLMWPV